MAPTASQISQLRRMTAEPTTATYSDDTLEEYIERYSCVDENGESPRVPSTSTPGEMMVNPDWTETYDLNSAAAAVWQEKAALVAHKHDFSADGASYTRSQMYEMCMKNVRWYLARRNPKTIILTPDVARERTYETNQA